MLSNLLNNYDSGYDGLFDPSNQSTDSGGFGDVVSSFFNVLNIPFHFMGITFTFLDVFWAGIILTLIGLAIGKIFFFVNNKR